MSTDRAVIVQDDGVMRLVCHHCGDQSQGFKPLAGMSIEPQGIGWIRTASGYLCPECDYTDDMEAEPAVSRSRGRL